MRPHRERLAHGLGGVRRSHGQYRDLAVSRFGQLDRRLEGVFVVGVDHCGHGRSVESHLRCQALPTRRGVGDRLHQYDDAHEA